ncbi:SRPBCC family protein [Rufibacter immobilis]|uniref:SRPBCC family protein n=1 Tax=Rufibacter immobilis TaxID=1348778 RepID=UPI0035EA5619
MENQTHAPATAEEQDFVITRVFDAPREQVFKAWTQEDSLKQWYGPKGYTLGISEFNLQPGGALHYSIQMGSGPKMWGKFVYREINSPEQLVYVNSFADEDGNITRAPFSATWPLEMLNFLTLTEQDGQTTLTLRGRPLNATQEERQTYAQGHTSMHQAFSGTMDQLAAYLAKVN